MVWPDFADIIHPDIRRHSDTVCLSQIPAIEQSDIVTIVIVAGGEPWLATGRIPDDPLLSDDGDLIFGDVDGGHAGTTTSITLTRNSDLMGCDPHWAWKNQACASSLLGNLVASSTVE